MKTAVMTAALMLAALGARAEMPQMFGNDPLSREILIKTAQANGGVTAAVRVESGQAIELKLSDVTAAPAFSAKLAPAAASAYLAIQPVAGLAPKRAKAKAKKAAPKRAVEQLKRVSKAKRWTEKP